MFNFQNVYEIRFSESELTFDLKIKFLDPESWPEGRILAARSFRLMRVLLSGLVESIQNWAQNIQGSEKKDIS